MAEEMVTQWLQQQDDGSFEVLCPEVSDPPGMRELALQDQVTHILTIPKSQALGMHQTYFGIPDAAALSEQSNNDNSQAQ